MDVRLNGTASGVIGPLSILLREQGSQGVFLSEVANMCSRALEEEL